MDSPQFFYTQTTKAHPSQLLGFMQQLEQRFGQLFFWQQDHFGYIGADAAFDFLQRDHQRFSQQHLSNQFGAVESQQTNPDYYQTAFAQQLAGLPQGWEWLPIWLLNDLKPSAACAHYAGLMRYNFRWDFRTQRLDFISIGAELGGWQSWLQPYQPQFTEGAEWQPQQSEADFNSMLKSLYQQCRQGQFLQKQAVRFFAQSQPISSLDTFAAYQAQQNSQAHFYYQLGSSCYFGKIEQSQQAERLPSQSQQVAAAAEGEPSIIVGYYQPLLQSCHYQEHWAYFQQQFPSLLLKAEPLLVDKNLNRQHIQQQQQQQEADRNSLFDQIQQI